MPFSLSEILLILVLFIVLVGPKDFPKVLRYLLGAYRQYQSWLRKITREVQAMTDKLENEVMKLDLNNDSSSNKQDRT